MSPHLLIDNTLQATGKPTGAAAAQRRQRIAVVGSGISGLSSAWLLSQAHDVVLFEQDARLGGHSHTIDAHDDQCGTTAVDTGFIVFNEPNYPNLTAMFAHLGVETIPARMSFGVSLDEGALEYASHGLKALFAQRRNLVNPRFWRMISDLLRFQKTAPRDLPELERSLISLDEYLKWRGYGPLFRDGHLLPQAAAIWSSSMKQMGDYPAASFIRFYMNHNLLSIDVRPNWRTVKGGSRQYVTRLRAAMSAEVHDSTPVRAIARRDDGVSLTLGDGRVMDFDAVVLACHSDQALRLLDQPTADEQRLLGAITYQKNRVVLHRDAGLMPRRRSAWAAWNHLGQLSDAGEGGVTYWMNKLQSLDGPPLFVTLNPTREPDPALVIEENEFEHPVFDVRAVSAQKELWSLQGVRNTWFCGAWFGAGFHEDGLQAGLAVAEQLGGVRRPWTVGNESGRITLAARVPQARAA